MSTVYFITHPNVHIDPDMAIANWSLSSIGTERMHKMLSQSWVPSIQSVFCSFERKAIDGAAILSSHLNLPYHKHFELGENDRSSTGYLPPSEFESVADQFFSSPLESIRGWETAQAAQNRVVAATKNITSSSSTKCPIAIVSHGAVGALLLCHLNGWVIGREHDQPGNGGGNFFCFNKNTGKVTHGWRAIDTESA